MLIEGAVEFRNSEKAVDVKHEEHKITYSVDHASFTLDVEIYFSVFPSI